MTCVSPAHRPSPGGGGGRVPVAVMPSGGGSGGHIAWADDGAPGGGAGSRGFHHDHRGAVGVLFAPSDWGRREVFAAPSTVPVGGGSAAVGGSHAASVNLHGEAMQVGIGNL